MREQNGKEANRPGWRLKPSHGSQRKAGDQRGCQQKPNRSCVSLPPGKRPQPEVLVGRRALHALHWPGRFSPAAPKGAETRTAWPVAGHPADTGCGAGGGGRGEPWTSNPAPFKALRKLSSAGKAPESSVQGLGDPRVFRHRTPCSGFPLTQFERRGQPQTRKRALGSRALRAQGVRVWGRGRGLPRSQSGWDPRAPLSAPPTGHLWG